MLDSKIAELHNVTAQPDFYKQPSVEVARTHAQLKDLHQQLAAAYERWETLEQLAK